MSDLQRRIDQQNIIIRTDFVTKQFKISNGTSYPIYINTSGSNPTTIKYDYLIQPHNDFVSPAITTNILTVYTPIIDLNNVSTLYCYDTIQTNPMNSASLALQNIGSLPGYPYSTNGLSSASGIPTINVDNLKNIYLIIQPISIPIIVTRVPLQSKIGHVQIGGGIVTVIPLLIPEAISIQLTTVSGLGLNAVVNAVQTDNFISINNPIPEYSVVLINPQTFYFIASPPGFVWDMRINNGKGVNYNYDVTITLDLINVGTSFTIFTRRFTGTALATGIPVNFLVKNNFQYVQGKYFVRCTVLNNLADDGQISILSNVYDLS